MKTLHLNLKKKWFDMILSGEKKEEYRDVTPYFMKKILLCGYCIGLFDHGYKSLSLKQWSNEIDTIECKSYEYIINMLYSGNFMFKNYETITFSNGMTPPVPRFEIELKGIEIKEGKEEWGAEPEIKYFALSLGKVIKSNI